MSEPKQYNISSLHPYIIEDKNGFMIYYEDYAELKAENARLKAFSDEAQAHIAKEERKSRERLDMEQAENARLKDELTDCKAEADRLKAEVERLTNLQSGADYLKAKEGKPSA